MNSLKERILSEMKVDHSNSLDKNFERAAKLIGITQTGTIEFRISKEKLKVDLQVLLYLAGKQFAFAGELSKTNSATQEELCNELGMLGGTLRPAIKRLKDKGKIKNIKDTN